MKFSVILIAFLSMLGPVNATESLDVEQIKVEMEHRFQSWDKSQKQEFHNSFLKVLEKWSWRTRYRDKVIEEKISLIYLDPDLLNFLFRRANALSAQDSYLLCNFGGWMSTLDEAGNCLAPWSKINRKNEVLQDLNEYYSRAHSCGGNGKFRCNPTVFGSGKDGKGFCVKTDDTDPNMATSKCIKNLEERGDKVQLENLIADPKKAATYIAMAAETIRYCNDYAGKALYCDDLIQKFEKSTSTVLSCIQGTILYPFLPQVVSPFNNAEIDKITGGLSTDFKYYQEDLGNRQNKVLEANFAILNKGIKVYSTSNKTNAMLAKLRKNLTRCLTDSCTGRSGTYRDGTKSKKKSLAKCLRYVKFGMIGKDKYLNDYPGTVNAVHSGDFLGNAGFTNLMENPSFTHLTPENAPVGAIIVYRKKNTHKGRPGHIEVKGSDSEYLSDFVNSSPTHVGGKRIPIGIYVKIPKEQKGQLIEVPEI